MEWRSGDMHLQLNDMPADGGAPEKTADFVGLLYRPAHYGIVVDQHGDSTEGVAEVAAAKHRFGPAGTARLRFDESCARLEDLSSREDATRA